MIALWWGHFGRLFSVNQSIEKINSYYFNYLLIFLFALARIVREHLFYYFGQIGEIFSNYQRDTEGNQWPKKSKHNQLLVIISNNHNIDQQCKYLNKKNIDSYPSIKYQSRSHHPNNYDGQNDLKTSASSLRRDLFIWKEKKIAFSMSRIRSGWRTFWWNEN